MNVFDNSTDEKNHRKFSPQHFVPKVETRHRVQPDEFLPAAGALDAAVHRLPPLVAHAAERARSFGDVVLEKVDPGVGGLPQVEGGHVRHAHRLLVLVSDHVIDVGVGMRELLECLAFCGEETEILSEAAIRLRCSGSHHHTTSERVSVDYSRQETAEAAHREVTNESTELLPDLLTLESPPRLWRYTNI